MVGGETKPGTWGEKSNKKEPGGLRGLEKVSSSLDRNKLKQIP